MPAWFWMIFAVGLVLPVVFGYVVAQRTAGAEVARQHYARLVTKLPDTLT